MSLRAQLNERPSLAIGVGVGLIVLAALGVFLTRGSGGGGISDRAFFTVDDGKNYFADDAAKIAPFDHDGKQAVRAYVYSAGGTRFVNHLERHTPEGVRAAQAAAEAAKAGKPTPRPAGKVGALTEVKRTGDAAWVPTNDMAKAAPIMTIRPPSGVTGEVTAVTP